ncbi:MAG TPA: hypothetical protein VIT65_14620 [Microlunatus sp.]
MLDSTLHGTAALLVYDDLESAQDYLVRVFGLTPGPVQRDDHGHAVHTEVVLGTSTSGCTSQRWTVGPRARSAQSPG